MLGNSLHMKYSHSSCSAAECVVVLILAVNIINSIQGYGVSGGGDGLLNLPNPPGYRPDISIIIYLSTAEDSELFN